MNILLTDAYSAQHIGNAVLVDSTLEQLKSEFPQAKFTILAFDPASISSLTECKTIETLWAESISSYSMLNKIWWIIRESLWVLMNSLNYSIFKWMKLFINPNKYTYSPKKLAILKAYSDADIVVSISGEALQDALWKRIPLFTYGYWLAHRMGKIVAIFPQSIGPANRWISKVTIRFGLNQCDLVLPRDQISLEAVKQLEINEDKVHLVPDVGINQPYISSKEARRLLEAEGVSLNRRPLVGMAISVWKEIDSKEYFSVMREICSFVTKNLNGTAILFSPNMPFREEVSDWEMAQKLYSSITSKDNCVLLTRTFTPREFKGLQGELDLFLSTRMHASILSTMIGTPTITINTQPKLSGFMKLIKQEERSCKVADFTIERAKILILDTLEKSDQIRLDLEKSRIDLGKKSGMASKLLKEVYEQ